MHVALRGITLNALAAREIDARVKHKLDLEKISQASAAYAVEASKRERLIEVYERDQSMVRQLKKMYEGKCQICNNLAFGGKFGSISEGHHIHLLSQGGADTLENLVLVCPNHHAAIHANNPVFDWSNLSFRFEGMVIKIALNKHLKPK